MTMLKDKKNLTIGLLVLLIVLFMCSRCGTDGPDETDNAPAEPTAAEVIEATGEPATTEPLATDVAPTEEPATEVVPTEAPTDVPAPTDEPATEAPTDEPAPAETTGVNLANFNRIQNGMTYEEVVAILGEEGTVMSETDIAGFKTVMYQWFGTGSLGANMNAMFQNGAMIQKAQFGLK